MKNYIILFLLITTCGCGRSYFDHWYNINIVNNTNYSIKGFIGPSFPDTSLLTTDTMPSVKILENSFVYVPSHSKGGFLSGGNWANVFHSLPGGIMSIYLFNTDTLNKYSWSQIVSGYKILKRYDLSLQDLEKMNWTITYP